LGAKATHYKELLVWQRAMELVALVYSLTKEFPAEEKFGLVSQLRRAAVSIPSNIAEGQGWFTTGEFKQFLGHARGSLFEVETQLALAERLDFIETGMLSKAEALSGEVGRMLNGLVRSLQ
jgi:four helix bundle protein